MLQYSAVLLLVASASAYIESLGGEVGSRGGNIPFHGKVAFICGKPAVHWTNGAWARDDRQGCLESLEDIREYCRRVYPDAKVSNVEPSPEEETVSGWCKFGERSCSDRAHSEHRVRPFLCLAGRYQSPALLVPEHCSFGHRTEDPRTNCKPLAFWNKTAHVECAKRSDKMASTAHLQSFGLLLPCMESKHAAWFAGVEYVCCPDAHVSKTSEIEAQVVHPKAEVSEAEQHTGKVVPRKEAVAGFDEKTPMNAYHEYMKHPDKDDLQEHDKFMDAKRELHTMLRNRERTLQIEFSRAEERIRENMQRSPEDAKKLMVEIEKRFQRTSKAISAEEKAELRQLDDVHQQRIQARLNRRKERARETFEFMLQEKIPVQNRIQKSLERLIRLEMKDKVHTINHFEHLRVADPASAAHSLQQVRVKLTAITAQINDAVALLIKKTADQSFAASIKKRIADFVESYDDVKKSELIIMRTLVEVPQKGEDKFDALLAQYHQQNMAEYERVKADKNELHVEPVLDDVKRPAVPHAEEEEEAGDDEMILNVQQHQKLRSHAKADSLSAVHQEQHPLGASVSYNVGTIVAVCAATIAVFLFLLVTVLAVRRRRMYVNGEKAGRFGGRGGYHMSVVEEPSTPEEKHLQSMQHVGYENPTYKYFEVATTDATNGQIPPKA